MFRNVHIGRLRLIIDHTVATKKKDMLTYSLETYEILEFEIVLKSS